MAHKLEGKQLIPDLIEQGEAASADVEAAVSDSENLGREFWVSLVAQMVKKSACNAGDLGSILGLGRSPRGGHGNPFQYSCLENLHGQRSLAGYLSMGLQTVGHNSVTMHGTRR